MSPLSRTIRRTTLIACVAVFIVGAPLLGAYSSGYRLTDAFTFVATGGIYIQSDLSGTRVYVGDEFVRQSGVFLRNTYVQNLRPNRTHVVFVERDGYTSWRKELYVRPNLVTEARVFMLPVERVWRTVASTTQVTLVSPSATSARSGVTTTLTTSSATTTDVINPEFALLADFFSMHRGQFEVAVATSTLEVVNGQVVATTTVTHEVQFPQWLVELASSTGFLGERTVRERAGIVAWLSETGAVEVVWGNHNNAPPHFFCLIQCDEHIAVRWSEPIEHFEFYPNRNDALLVATRKGVFALELDDRGGRSIIPLMEGEGLSFRVRDSATIVIFDGEVFHVLSL